MQITRGKKLAAVAAVGVMALAACSEGGDSGGDGVAPPTGVECAGGTLSAEGSSAQKNAMFEWISLYQEACPDATVNYNPTGSGSGISQFLAGLVDFAGSDAYLSPDEAESAEQRCGAPAWNLPAVAGPIGIPFNLEGVESLILDAPTTAKIFKGTIDNWNDPEIAALNPGVTLPDAQIAVFFRSDESGTQKSFTAYLNAAAPKVWDMEPAKAWPSGAAPQAEGREKSSGVLEAVVTTPNSIAFLDWSDILSVGLPTASIDAGSGPVELTAETASAAIGAGEIVGKGNNLKIDLDYATTAPSVYPIVQLTYEIVCSAGLDENQTALVKSFLSYITSEEGQAVLPAIGYTAIPSDVLTKVQTAVGEIQ